MKDFNTLFTEAKTRPEYWLEAIELAQYSMAARDGLAAEMSKAFKSIRSIQAEAEMSGMRKAADICEKRRQGNEVINSTYLAGESLDCRDAILLAAQQIEKGE